MAASRRFVATSFSLFHCMVSVASQRKCCCCLAVPSQDTSVWHIISDTTIVLVGVVVIEVFLYDHLSETHFLIVNYRQYI